MAMTFPLPVFRRDVSDEFCKEVGTCLAEIYKKWTEHHREQCDEAVEQGNTVARIEINYAGWIAYCRATGATPGLENLLDFTVRKSAKGITPPAQHLQ